MIVGDNLQCVFYSDILNLEMEACKGLMIIW